MLCLIWRFVDRKSIQKNGVGAFGGRSATNCFNPATKLRKLQLCACETNIVAVARQTCYKIVPNGALRIPLGIKIILCNINLRPGSHLGQPTCRSPFVLAKVQSMTVCRVGLRENQCD